MSLLSDSFYTQAYSRSNSKLSYFKWKRCVESAISRVVENPYVQQCIKGAMWRDLLALSDIIELASLKDEGNKQMLKECVQYTRQAWNMGFTFTTYNKGEEWVLH